MRQTKVKKIKHIIRNIQKNQDKRIWGEKKGRPRATIMSNLIKAAAGAAG